MRFTLRHPAHRDRRAEYGYERDAFAFFVHVFEQDACVGRYDALTEGYDHRFPLQGALDYLISQGFFSREDLESALTRGQYELFEEMPRRLRRAGLVVHHFKEAAD